MLVREKGIRVSLRLGYLIRLKASGIFASGDVP